MSTLNKTPTPDIKLIPKTFRITKTQYELFESECKKQNLSPSLVVRSLIQGWINHITKEKENEKTTKRPE